MSDAELETVFKSFCAFGAGAKESQAMMDNAKFAKLFRDLKLYDKKFTQTDTDIIFNRTEVKRWAQDFQTLSSSNTLSWDILALYTCLFDTCSKTDRKINFSQFKKALELCAEKKYGSKDDLQKFIDKVCAGKGPGTSGATVSRF